MNVFRLFLHRTYRKVVKIILALSYDFQTWQECELPSGPKIFCSNHFSSSDVHFVTTLSDDVLHIVIGPGFGIPVVGSFLGWTEQIPALTKEDRKQVVAKAVSYLQKGESVYIFPEGGLNTQETLQTGHRRDIPFPSLPCHPHRAHRPQATGEKQDEQDCRQNHDGGKPQLLCKYRKTNGVQSGSFVGRGGPRQGLSEHS